MAKKKKSKPSVDEMVAAARKATGLTEDEVQHYLNGRSGVFAPNPVTDKRISLGDAAAAANVEWKRLRNWLDRSQIKLDADEERQDIGKHRRFSFLDVIRIATVGHLMRFGVTAERASAFTDQIFNDQLVRFLRMYRNTPPQAVHAFFQNKIFIITWDDKTGDYSGLMLAPQIIGADTKIAGSPVLLLIDVAEIVVAVFGRLKEVLK